MLEWLAGLDAAALRAFQDATASDAADRLFTVLSGKLNLAIAFIAVGIVLTALAGRRGILALVLAAVSAGVTLGINDLVWKPLFGRDRPPIALGVAADGVPGGIRLVGEVPDQPSFPSGHTSTGFAVGLTLAAFVIETARRRRLAGAPRWQRWALTALALLPLGIGLGTSISRLHLGVHFPLDIVAGIIWGGSVAAVVVAVGFRLESRVLGIDDPFAPDPDASPASSDEAVRGSSPGLLSRVATRPLVAPIGVGASRRAVPQVLSVAGFAIGVAGLALFTSGLGAVAGAVAAFILVIGVIVGDAAAEVARVRPESSTRGEALDVILGCLLQTLLPLAVGVGLERATGEIDWRWLGLVGAIATAACSAFEIVYVCSGRGRVVAHAGRLARERGGPSGIPPFDRFIEASATRDVVWLALVFAVIGRLDLLLPVLALVATGWFVAALLAVTIFGGVRPLRAG